LDNKKGDQDLKNKICTEKDYQERINKILTYINENIMKEISLDDLAREACFSKFHIHRIFSAYVGETLNSYILRTKLSKAATRLCSDSTKNVTDVAMRAGYDTPAAFTKAFKKYFGMSPRDFVKKDCKAETVFFVNPEKINVSNVNAKIVSVDPVNVLFVRRTGEYLKSSISAWRALIKFADEKKLFKDNVQAIGIGYDDPTITEPDKIRYEACISVDDDVAPEGEFGVKRIPGGKYIKLLHKGPYQELENSYRKLYQFVLQNEISLGYKPCFDKYLNSPQSTKPEDLRTEIYLPVE